MTNINLFPLVLLFIGGVILTVGDIFMKKWIGSSHAYWYAAGLILYILGMNFLAQSFRYKNIAVASVIFVIFNVVTLSLFSWLYFKEKISFMEMSGMALGLLSIVILEMSGNN